MTTYSDSMIGMGHCYLHGSYYGWTCPGCNTAPMPTAPSVTVDNSPVLARIAAALERIAAELERRPL